MSRLSLYPIPENYPKTYFEHEMNKDPNVYMIHCGNVRCFAADVGHGYFRPNTSWYLLHSICHELKRHPLSPRDMSAQFIARFLRFTYSRRDLYMGAFQVLDSDVQRVHTVRYAFRYYTLTFDGVRHVQRASVSLVNIRKILSRMTPGRMTSAEYEAVPRVMPEEGFVVPAEYDLFNRKYCDMYDESESEESDPESELFSDTTDEASVV